MDSRKALKTLIFDNPTMRWIPAQLDAETITTGMVETLSLLTYNVWHEKSTLEERTTELLKILQQSSADFICLQEVTKPFLSALLDSDWVREEYYIPEI